MPSMFDVTRTSQTEADPFGPVEVPVEVPIDSLYGLQTERARINFYCRAAAGTSVHRR